MERYKTSYTCSREIQFKVDENGILTYVKFCGGCAGNTQGVARLATGMHVDDVIKKTEGILCRAGTSCPDQLSKALKEYKIKNGL